MAGNNQIIELYSELANKPETDFGWAKGLENAKAHKYSQEWFEELPEEMWQYCAAVGNPFSLGEIKKGATVLDLGCGAGVDLLVSAYLVGETGKAIGVDITPKMVAKAKEHAALGGFSNVEVYESSFEEIPLEDESVDVVISNGAINLTSCKESVFAEIYRVLKPEGKIYFADMIDISEEDACRSSEKTSCCDSQEGDWANCVAGTLRAKELISIIQNAGFKDVACDALTHYTTAETTQGATFRATKIAGDKLRESHWENMFQTQSETKFLWYESLPQTSLEFIKKYSDVTAKIIDAGCGASLLVDNLLNLGYRKVTLLDTSKTSLEIVKKRVQKASVSYVCEDILNFKSDEKFDIWHDRAAFHFLRTKKEREKYFEVLEDSLEETGTAVLSTFRIEGPLACAGLDIVQYDREKMLLELPKTLEIIETLEYEHKTFKETAQKYIYFVIKKV